MKKGSLKIGLVAVSLALGVFLTGCGEDIVECQGSVVIKYDHKTDEWGIVERCDKIGMACENGKCVNKQDAGIDTQEKVKDAGAEVDLSQKDTQADLRKEDFQWNKYDISKKDVQADIAKSDISYCEEGQLSCLNRFTLYRCTDGNFEPYEDCQSKGKLCNGRECVYTDRDAGVIKSDVYWPWRDLPKMDRVWSDVLVKRDVQTDVPKRDVGKSDTAGTDFFDGKEDIAGSSDVADLDWTDILNVENWTTYSEPRLGVEFKYPEELFEARTRKGGLGYLDIHSIARQKDNLGTGAFLAIELYHSNEEASDVGDYSEIDSVVDGYRIADKYVCTKITFHHDGENFVLVCPVSDQYYQILYGDDNDSDQDNDIYDQAFEVMLSTVVLGN